MYALIRMEDMEYEPKAMKKRHSHLGEYLKYLKPTFLPHPSEIANADNDEIIKILN